MLGHKASDEAKWQDCDLARVLISEEDVQQAARPLLDNGEVHPSTFVNYGIGEHEKGTLFHVLPEVTPRVTMEAMRLPENADPRKILAADAALRKVESEKLESFARLVDLRNANARGIAFENRRRVVAAFSEPENPTDTGRPEVQGACLAFPPSRTLSNSLLQRRLPQWPSATSGTT